MAFNVFLPKKVLKQLDRIPEAVQDTFLALVEDLKAKGPIQHTWPNFSKLGVNKYHCHLSYSWVACWWSEKGTIQIEVTYVGSRQNAPY